MDLSGRVAVVTGGSRGLGREMVLAFARLGADVVIASRKIDACEALAAEVRSSTGRTAVPVAFHAGRWADCDMLTERVYDEFGRCDILVNNAGSTVGALPFLEITSDQWDASYSVNLKGTADFCQSLHFFLPILWTGYVILQLHLTFP